MFNLTKRVVSIVIAASVSLAFAAAGAASAAEVRYEHKSDIGKDLKLPVHEWTVPDTTPKGIIVANQGLVFSGKAYDDIARHLANEGYFVYALDFRGFGDWVKNYEDFGGDPDVHFGQTKEDITRLLKRLGQQYKDTPIFLLGESMGANYSIWEAATEPYLIDGVIGISPCFQLRVHPRALWLNTFVEGLCHPKKPMNVAPYFKPLLADTEELTNACLSDPAVCTKLSATDLIKAWITNHHTLEDLEHIPQDLPMLFIVGDKDKIQNPKKIKDSLPRIGSQKITYVSLPQRGHVLVEHQAVDPQIATTLLDWLHKNGIRKVASTQPAAPVEAQH